MPSGKAIGEWNGQRDELPSLLVKNLHRLRLIRQNNTPLQFLTQETQLHQELNMHWHSLGNKEKQNVLEMLTTPENSELISENDTEVDSNNRPAARKWLDITIGLSKPSEREAFSSQASSEVKHLVSDLAAPINKLTEVAGHFKNDTAIDLLFDYKAFLSTHDTIGTIPDAGNKSVGIIGAGAAGLAAAYELQKTGVNVTVLEAEDHIGGRMDSRSFSKQTGLDTPTKAEMGAMRFPSQGISEHYFNIFNIETQPGFPNPGTVHTRLKFDDKVIEWPANKDPESEVVLKVRNEFAKMMGNFLEPMEHARLTNNTSEMQNIWAEHIDTFKDMNFEQGNKYLVEKYGLDWGAKHFEALDAIGVGTGGFGVLNQVAFLDLLRVQIDSMEKNQQLLTKGATDFVSQFAEGKVELPDGSTTTLSDSGAIEMGAVVKSIKPNKGEQSVSVSFDDQNGNTIEKKFDTVIFTGSPRSAIATKLNITAVNDDPAFDAEVAHSLTNNMHLVNSSKLFIRIDSKIWQDENGENIPNFPRNIQGGNFHGAYLYDYPGSDAAVLLVSYTWEEKSAAIQSLEPRDRLELFKSELNEIAPEIAKHIDTKNSPMHCIDWQNEKYQGGAFKLAYPGHEKDVNNVYFDFQKTSVSETNTRVVIANDGVSHHGGWVAGALRTGINAASASVISLGGEVPPDSPFFQSQLYKEPMVWDTE